MGLALAFCLGATSANSNLDAQLVSQAKESNQQLRRIADSLDRIYTGQPVATNKAPRRAH